MELIGGARSYQAQFADVPVKIAGFGGVFKDTAGGYVMKEAPNDIDASVNLRLTLPDGDIAYLAMRASLRSLPVLRASVGVASFCRPTRWWR